MGGATRVDTTLSVTTALPTELRLGFRNLDPSASDGLLAFLGVVGLRCKR
jgi:hypothetical protein